jgi:23S rRNA (cytidine1920-2'-O)/16S rRNA (cytidine1409-2'-O)-methyltransferase
VVHDPERREDAVKSVLDFARVELGLNLQGVVPSAITGHKGNQEYLAAWKKCIT